MQWLKNLFKKKMYVYACSFMSQGASGAGYLGITYTLRRKLNPENFSEILEAAKRDCKASSVVLLNCTYLGTKYE